MRAVVACAAVVAVALGGLGSRSSATVPSGLACLGGAPPTRPITATCSASGVVVDVHRGAGATAQPVIVWLHGGAWLAGSRSDIDPVVADQVARGWTVISVDYRVGEGVHMRDIVTDVGTAVRWTRARAALLNIDPDRIVLAGFSAGAHLAALAGLAPNQDEALLPLSLQDVSGRPNGILAMSGVYDLRSWHVVLALLGDSQLILGLVIGCTTASGDPEPCPARRLTRFSPVTKLAVDDPPVLLVHGRQDPVIPVGQALTMYAALQAAGVRSSVATWDEDHCVEMDHTHARVERFLDRIAGVPA